MRRAARIDSTQREIVSDLRKLGATVQPLHTVGGGVPDLLVGWKGLNWLVECKSKGKGLNELQKTWHADWRGSVIVATDVETIMAVIREG